MSPNRTKFEIADRLERMSIRIFDISELMEFFPEMMAKSLQLSTQAYIAEEWSKEIREQAMEERGVKK